MPLPPIPSLPTDSLYKFCAFAGIMGIALSLYFVVARHNGTWKRIEDLDRDANKGLIEIEALQLEVNQEGKPPDTEAGHQIARLRRDSIKTRQLSLADLRARSAGLHREAKFEIYSGLALIFLLIIASASTFFGLSNWYLIQRKQDKLLDLELKKRR